MYRPFSVKQNKVKNKKKKCTVNSTGFTDIFMHSETRKRLKWTVLYKPLCRVTLDLLPKKCGDYLLKLTFFFVNYQLRAESTTF